MGELHPSMEELLRDKDGDYSEARIMSAVRELQREGRKNRSILRGMLKAMIVTSADLDPTQDYCFLQHCKRYFDNAVGVTDKFLLEMRDNRPPPTA